MRSQNKDENFQYLSHVWMIEKSLKDNMRVSQFLGQNYNTNWVGASK